MHQVEMGQISLQSIGTQKSSCNLTPFYVISNSGEYILLMKFHHAGVKYYFTFDLDSNKLCRLDLIKNDLDDLEGFEFQRAFFVTQKVSKIELSREPKMVKLVFRKTQSFEGKFNPSIHQVKDKIPKIREKVLTFLIP